MLSSRHDGLFAPAEVRAALRLHALAIDVEHLNDPAEVDLALLAFNVRAFELGLHLLFQIPLGLEIMNYSLAIAYDSNVTMSVVGKLTRPK